MVVSAVATAGYAYLVGPVLRSLFLRRGDLLDHGAGNRALDTLSDLAARLSAADPRLLGAAIVVAAGIKGISYFGQSSLAGRAGQEILCDLRARMYCGLLALNPLGSTASKSGELVTRFTLDVEAAQGAISRGIVSFARDSLQILALAGLAVMLDPMLGLLGLVAFPPVAVLIVKLGKRLRSRRIAVHAAFGEVGDAVDEASRGLQVIQAYGAEALMLERFESKSRRILKSAVKAIVLKSLSSPLNELLGAAALGLTLYYAHGRISAGLLTPEAFVSFFTALFLLYQPVKSIGQAGHAVHAGLAGLERLRSLVEFAPAPQESRRIGTPLPEHSAQIRLDQVTAGYHRGPDVLKGIDLVVEAGSTVAVVGPSGAGKTTLLNVLLGTLPLRSGTLQVNGRPIDPTRENRRRLFAPVFQEPFLFDDTIAMNVRCGRPDASGAEIDAACRAAGVLAFAGCLEGGIDTRVGPGGSALSVGQRQRVCLARALISRAPVLLFDEVTASLDGETELALVGQLSRFIGGRTAIVVTHRLSTASWADRIALLEDGVIQETGPSGEKLKNSPRFGRLFGEQSARPSACRSH